MPLSGASTAASGSQREMSDAVFASLSAIVERKAGLVLQPSKRLMVGSRIFKRVKALGLSTFEDYCAFVESSDGQAEHRELIGVLTTNVTSFFRENHHFQHFEAEILPGLIEDANSGKRVRLWSAGCSTGAEPYSLALTLLQHFPKVTERDVKILASDIDPVILKTAQQGIYPKATVDEEVPDHHRKHFDSVDETRVQVSAAARSLVSVRPLNLIEPWPVKGPFAAIFCRNVVIYFSAKTTDHVWSEFSKRIVDGGCLYVGHSERVKGPATEVLKPCGVTVYRKTPE